jgi:hypothetical protein
MGALPCLPLCDQALSKYLAQQGQQALQVCFGQVSLWLQEQGPLACCPRLAPFASEVLALEESNLDRMTR